MNVNMVENLYATVVVYKTVQDCIVHVVCYTPMNTNADIHATLALTTIAEKINVPT